MKEYKEHIDQQLFEQIEAYLLNTMDAARRAAFEREMEADEKLRNEVSLQRRLTAVAEVSSYKGEKQEQKKQGGPAVVKKLPHFAWYAAAAVVIVAVTWFYRNNTPSAEKIYARYFIPDSGLPVVMSSANDDYDFYDGMVSYKEENFARAIEIWKKVYLEHPANDTLQYYMGMAYLNSNDSSAVAYLLPVAANDNSRWQPKAIWYLALAYVKTGRKEEAAIWLKKLSNDEQARLLEKDIKKLSP
jgi:tetratricopeptide (TPR) repeat protein